MGSGGAASASRRIARRPEKFRKAAPTKTAAGYGGVSPSKPGRSSSSSSSSRGKGSGKGKDGKSSTAEAAAARTASDAATRLKPTKTDSSDSDSQWEVTVEARAEECLVCFEPFDDALNPPIRTKCLCGTTARLHLQVGLFVSFCFVLFCFVSLFSFFLGGCCC